MVDSKFPKQYFQNIKMRVRAFVIKQICPGRNLQPPMLRGGEETMCERVRGGEGNDRMVPPTFETKVTPSLPTLFRLPHPLPYHLRWRIRSFPLPVFHSCGLSEQWPFGVVTLRSSDPSELCPVTVMFLALYVMQVKPFRIYLCCT